MMIGTTISFLVGVGLILAFILVWRKVLRLHQKIHTTEAISQEHQNRFDSVFAHTNIGMALLNLDGRFLKVNSSLCQILGYDETEILNMNFYYVIHPNELHHFQSNVQQLWDKKIHSYQCEQQCFKKDGDIVWIIATLFLIEDASSKPAYFIIQVQNITTQKTAEEKLRHMAYHDPLTGLANRNKLEQFINHMLASAKRHQHSFSLFYLDLDRFKNINDTIGHEAGDLILQIVAERLKSAIRGTDIVARLGGDEFVLVITDVKKTESLALIAQKILDNVLKVMIVKGQEIYITTSIGISLYPHDGQNMDKLMKNADLALYRAKEHGRNNYQFYTLEMTSRVQQKMALQNALGRALVKNEFLLHYQPKMDIATGKITGVEALLRWQNKVYGMVTPDEIVALAEETGLIIPVSEWVIRTACDQLKEWHEKGLTYLSIAVNCSARQFKQATFVDDVLSTLTQVGLSPQFLEVEVTESMIMQDPENILRILYALQDLGVKIAIDDFGTGYWSLNHLKRLSVDKIKIDKTFIKQLTMDEVSATIIKAIIAMANKLQIKTIAEGVETREQYSFLVKEGCTEIQGYYLSQPLSAEKIIEFLKNPAPEGEEIQRGEVTTL